MDFKTILEAGDLAGKRILVRVDWNVPLEKGRVVEDFRIKQSLPLIEHLKNAGAKIILLSHLESKETESLYPVYEHASGMLSLMFCTETIGDKAVSCISMLKNGEVLLLENLRKNKGEKENSREFALALSDFGDMYVNEAFSASHREHASIVGIPKLLPSFAGLQFTEEVKRLSKAFYPKHPFLFILGGAKFDTKLPLIEKFINIADFIFVGGALAHNFFKENGNSLGDSLVSEGEFDLKAKLETGKIMLPLDLVIKGKDGMGTDTIEHVGTGDMIVDAGNRTIEALKSKIHDSQFILWNGPLGNYELGYKNGTLALAKILAESGKEVIVGGADTIASIKELNISEKFSFISTGGGAMLDFLSSGTLPGIESIKRA
jgi:phosphoglycerate kinase